MTVCARIGAVHIRVTREDGLTPHAHNLQQVRHVYACGMASA